MNKKTNENQNEEWNNLKEEELLNKRYVLLKQKSGDILQDIFLIVKNQQWIYLTNKLCAQPIRVSWFFKSMILFDFWF